MSRPRRRIIKRVEQPEIPPKVWSIAKRQAQEAIRVLQHTPEIAFNDLLAMMYCQGVTDMGQAIHNNPRLAGMVKRPSVEFPEIEIM